jgi:hypothetical protein
LRPSQGFLKRVDYVHKKASDTFTHLSLQRWAGIFESRPFKGLEPSGKEAISPLILKRTFAREWLLSGGCLGTLQKQFSHKHLWSTAHYLRFVMEDVKPDHARMLTHAYEEGAK